MKRVLQGKEEWPKRDKKTQESVVESMVYLWEMGHCRGQEERCYWGRRHGEKKREHKPREGRGVEVAGLVEGLSGKEGGVFTL